MAGRNPSLPEPSADWWTLWPGLYQAELDAFTRHGAQVEVVHKKAGVAIFMVDWPRGEEVVRLRVGFSPMHPFARPAVAAPEVKLQRHQHRLDGGLCLLTQHSGEWRPAQRVADFLAEQLGKVFDANAARTAGRMADAARLEEQAADPISPYYAHLAEDDWAIFYAADQRAPKGPVGFATFALAPREAAPQALEAVLRRLQPASGNWLGQPFGMPTGDPGSEREVVGRWVRMTPPAVDDVGAILAAADAAIEAATSLQPKLRDRMSNLARAEIAITGLIFEEELAYGPEAEGDGWLFIVSWNAPNGGDRRHSLVRGYRITDDLQSRVPVAQSLADKKALVIGVGAIGSFAALELARAGVRDLTIIDDDVVEPGNGVRWPLGRSVWGLRKTSALMQFVVRNYPGTRVRGIDWKIGDATTQAPPRGHENRITLLRRLIGEADVVIDASASTECQHAVAYTCRTAGKPLVVGYATEGAAGGVVAKFPVGAEACFVCLQAHWKDRSFPHPAVDKDGTVTPIGCNQPTFTGAAFDLQEVSLEMVRSAVELLVGDAHNRGDWQVGVLSLRDGARRCLPRWEAANLTPRCDGCSGS